MAEIGKKNINTGYIIRLLGRKAMCPLCTGMLAFQDEERGYKCNDCGTRFMPTGAGITDRELECRIV